MIRQLMRVYPEVPPISMSTLDRRLRQLDQDLECRYWQEGLELLDREMARGSAGTSSPSVPREVVKSKSLANLVAVE